MEDIYFEIPFNIFARNMKDNIVWLIDLKYIKIKNISFNEETHSEIINSSFFKSYKGKLKESLKANKFKYSEYFQIEELIYKNKLIHNPHYRLDYFIEDIESLILVPDTEKIRKYLELYTRDILEKNRIIIDRESILLKNLIKKETLDKACESFCRKQVYCGFLKI